MLSKNNFKLFLPSRRLHNLRLKSLDHTFNKTTSRDVFRFGKYLPDGCNVNTLNTVFKRFNSNQDEKKQTVVKNDDNLPFYFFGFIILIIGAVLVYSYLEEWYKEKFQYYIRSNNTGFQVCDCGNHVDKIYFYDCKITSYRKKIYQIRTRDIELKGKFSLENQFGKEDIKQLEFNYDINIDLNRNTLIDMISKKIKIYHKYDYYPSNSEINVSQIEKLIMEECQKLFDQAFKEEIDAYVKKYSSEYKPLTAIKTRYPELNKNINDRFAKIIAEKQFKSRGVNNTMWAK